MSTPAFEMKPALRRGWMLMKRHFGPFAVLGVVCGLVQALIDAVGSSFLRIVLELFNVALGMIWIRFALSVDAGHPPDTAEIRPTLSLYLEYLLASVVYGLIVAVGLALLIVPGVIWAVRFGLFPFFVIDQRVDAMAALRRSLAVTKGITWPLFLFGLLLLGINLLGAIAFGVGLLVSVPTTMIAAAHVYKQVRNRIPIPQAPSPTAPQLPQPS